MLQVSRQAAEGLLAKCIEQGQALIERVSLIGDSSDYESWKAARKQWIELTAETLGHIYDGSEEADQFKSAASAGAGGRRWQTEYKRDSKCVQAAVDFLISLRDRLELAQEPTGNSEPAQEPTSSPELAPAPTVGAELAPAPSAGAELAPAPSASAEHPQEPPGDSELAQAPTSEPELLPAPSVGSEHPQQPTDDSELAQAPTSDSEHAPAPSVGSELADESTGDSEHVRAPSVGSELAPAPAGASVIAQEASGGVEVVQQSANGSASSLPATTSADRKPNGTSQVFLVHGRNEIFKQAVAGLLERAGPHEVTILNERTNDRRALGEHFEEQTTGSGYAVVLLTADDVGAPRLDSDREPYFSPRARQGVVFEMGVLVATLTPRCVCVLYEDGVELPCDLDGIVYIRLDLAGTWQSKLLLHLRSAGFDYDLNTLAPA
jgi:predicted nucleotide-binding protein